MKNKIWWLLGSVILVIGIFLPSMSALASSSSSITLSGTIPLVITNVNVSNITTNSATISWTTSNQSTSSVSSQVFYGITTGYGQNAIDNSSINHSVNLTGLLSGTTYYYDIQSIAIIGGVTFSATKTGSFTTVSKIGTMTILEVVPEPSIYGQSVTISAAVLSTWLKGIPTGTVNFLIGTTIIGTGSLDKLGLVSFTTSALMPGNYAITSVYVGNATYASSVSNSWTHTVKKTNTLTSITSSINPSVEGRSIAFTANVMPKTVTGTITFKDGGRTLGTAALSGGSASFSINSLTVGLHSITAVYSGDSIDNSINSSTITETIVAKPVITTTSLPNGIKGSTYSQTLSVSGELAPFTWSISGAPS